MSQGVAAHGAGNISTSVNISFVSSAAFSSDEVHITKTKRPSPRREERKLRKKAVKRKKMPQKARKKRKQGHKQKIRIAFHLSNQISKQLAEANVACGWVAWSFVDLVCGHGHCEQDMDWV